MWIGYEHADSLLTYPQANNLSMNAQPIRERGHHPNRITRGAHAHRLPTPPGTQPTQSPPHRARSRHSRRPASLRAIDRNGHMDSTCTSHPPHRARSRHSHRPASHRANGRKAHMDNNRLPRLPAPSADTRMSVRAANLATRSSGSLKPNLSASAGRAHERPRAGPRPRARRKPPRIPLVAPSTGLPYQVSGSRPLSARLAARYRQGFTPSLRYPQPLPSALSQRSQRSNTAGYDAALVSCRPSSRFSQSPAATLSDTNHAWSQRRPRHGSDKR